MSSSPTSPNRWFRQQLLQQKYQPINVSQISSQVPSSISQSQFKRFQIPPNIDLSILHQTATNFGYDSIKNNELCPCCHEPVKDQLTFKQATEKCIYKINEPVGFYFSFIKMMLLAMLFVIVIPGIYSVVAIIDNCSHDQSQCDYVYGIPFPRIATFYTTTSLVLSAVTTILLYVLVAFLFYWNVLIHQKINYSNQKAADHHSFVSGYDSKVISEVYFRQYLGQYEIDEIIYTYKIKEMIKLFSKKNKYEALKNSYYRSGKDKKYQKMDRKIKKIDKDLIPIKNLFELGKEQELRTDKIFIKFKTKQDKQKFQAEYKKNIFHRVCATLRGKSKLDLNNCQLHIQSLGDPRQIIWQNLERTSTMRYLAIFLNNIIMIVVLGISFFAVLKLTIYQSTYKEAADVLLSFIFSLIISGVNLVLAVYIDYSTDLEGRYTKTAQIQNKIIKKILSFFLNATLTPFALLIIQSYRTEETEEDIIRNIFTLFLLSNIISPIISQFVQIPILIKLYKRRKIKYQGKQNLETQISSNLIFQNFDFNLQDRYSLICQRLAMCFFYASIFPVGALLTGLGLIISYFLGKKMLIKYCSIPRLSFKLGMLITRIASFFPLVYSLGFVLNLFTYNQQISADSFYSTILLVLSVPISLIFFSKGHELARKYITVEDLEKTKIFTPTQVSYKDLNPATFFLGQSGRMSETTPSQILMNVMKFTAFKEALNIWKMGPHMLNYQRENADRQAY